MADKASIAAIVLAAGRSTRMDGTNKLLLPHGDRTIVATAVYHLLEAGYKTIIVVTGHQEEKVRAGLQGVPVTFCSNPDHASGLSTSIRCGVRAAPATAKWFLFCLGDMPQVQASTLVRLREVALALTPQAILIPTTVGKRGNPVMFSSSFRKELLRLSGDRGALPLIKKHTKKVVEVPVNDSGIFFDVDTNADLDRFVSP